MNPSDKLTSSAIYVFFGMIATGKSTLAKQWANSHDFLYYNSDVVRKDFRIDRAQNHKNDSFEKGIYTKEFTQKTYGLLFERAKSAIANNCSVVLDASFSQKNHRDEATSLAKKINCSIYFIFCTCPELEMRRRMELRAKDPTAISDGRWEIYLEQNKIFELPTSEDERFISLDTSDSPEVLLKTLESRIVAS